MSSHPTAVPTRASARFSGSRVTSATAVGVGEFVEASFATFERTYGAQFASSRDPKDVADDDDDDDDDDLAISMGTLLLWLPWSSLMSSMFPIMFLWTRRSMFGVASLLRSFLIGHALRLILAILTSVTIPNPVRDRVSSVLIHLTLYFGGPGEKGSQSSLHQLQQAVLGRMDPNSCPPPALTLLAFLTAFAFVVHPDGLTWILLGRLRDGIQYIFRSSTLCLSMIKDGTVPTLAASGSLAGLIAVAGVIHRAMRPPPQSSRGGRKSGDNPSQNSRGKHKGKKNRGRGHHGHGHHSGNGHGRPGRSAGRIKAASNVEQQQSTRKIRSLSPPKIESEMQGAPSECDDKRSHNEQPSTLKMKEPEADRCDASNDSVCPGRKMSSTSLEVVPDDGSEVTSCSSLSIPNFASITPAVPVSPTPSKANSISTSGKMTSEGKKNGRQNKNNHNSRGRGHNRRKKTFPAPTQSKFNGHKKKETSVMPGGKPKSHPTVFTNIVSTIRRSLSPSRPSTVRTFNKVTTKPVSVEVTSESHQNYSTSSFFSSSNSSNNPRPSTQNESSPSGSSSRSMTTHYSVPSSSQITAQFCDSDIAPLVDKEDPEACPVLQPSPSITPPPSSPQILPLQSCVPDTSHNVAVAAEPYVPQSSSYYCAPNHGYNDNYPPDNFPYTPGKIELASFLSQVGLISSIIAQLLRDLSNIDALYNFTDVDYARYYIDADKKRLICSMLNTRRCRMYHQQQQRPIERQWKPPPSTQQVIRPPPGLGYDNNYRSNAAPQQPSHHFQDCLPSYAPNTHSCNVAMPSPIHNNVSSPPKKHQPNTHYSMPTFPLTVEQYERQYTSSYSVHESPTPATVINNNSSLPHVLNGLNGQHNAAIESTDDDISDEHNRRYVETIIDDFDEPGENSIEADLLAQVGGQMAVSILDF